MEVALENIRQAEGMVEAIMPLKEKLEKRLNLSRQVEGERDAMLTLNKVMRICLIASLSLTEKRSVDGLGDIVLSKSSQRIMPSFFTKDNKKSLFSALLKLRYRDCEVDWQNASIVGRIVAKEIYRGIAYLSEDENLNAFLFAASDRRHGGSGIPALELLIGEYAEDMEAKLNINGRSVSNAQILVAGTTGSGKTNLLAVLIQQFRNLTPKRLIPSTSFCSIIRVNSLTHRMPTGLFTSMWIGVASSTLWLRHCLSRRSRILRVGPSTKSISIPRRWLVLSVL